MASSHSSFYLMIFYQPIKMDLESFILYYPIKMDHDAFIFRVPIQIDHVMFFPYIDWGQRML